MIKIALLALALFACSTSKPKSNRVAPSAPVLQAVQEQCKEWGKGWKLSSQGSIAFCQNTKTELRAYSPSLPSSGLKETPRLLDLESDLADLLNEGFLLQTGFSLMSPWQPCSHTPQIACLQAKILDSEQTTTYSLISTFDATNWVVFWAPDSSFLPKIDAPIP